MYEIFPEQGTDILCQLSELEEVRPSEVLKLVLAAAPVQIAAFLQLAKTTEGTQERGRQKSAEYREIRERTEEREPVSPIGSVKGLAAEDAHVVLKMDCPTDEKSEFWNQLKKLIPP